MVERHFSLRKSLYLVILLVLVYLIISAWDETLDFIFIQFCGLERDSLEFHLAHAIFFTALGLLFLYILNEDFGFLFGIEEED